ncbi:MAG: hypothetical protein RLZZ437_2537 [Pseudomonadota bacterium]|jgi:hypothetical protein
MRAGIFIGLTMLLTACQTGGGPATLPADSPLAGEPIETTTLDAPVVGLAEEQAQDNPEPVVEVAEPTAESDAASEDPTPEEPAAVEEPEAIDPALQTPQAIACTRQGGVWSRIGQGEARACLRQTRDAGKRCDSDRDCQGVCLARSGTCAPVDPLFGCNEVLQDDGRRMTLCLN